jgi:hypothetical protein
MLLRVRGDLLRQKATHVLREVAILFCEVFCAHPAAVSQGDSPEYTALNPTHRRSLIFVGTDLAAELGYTPHACLIWYIFQFAGTQALVASVEIILILRGASFS